MPLRTLARSSPGRLIALAATLFGAALRFTALHRLPPPAWYDEVWFALIGRELRADWRWLSYYVSGDRGIEIGPGYLTALVQALGLDSITALRVVTAASGTLAIPLTYACVRLLLREEPHARRDALAALAAVLTACLPAFVVISRVGNEPGLALPPLLFAVWQMLRGIAYQRRSGWLLAGIAAGLGLYLGFHARFALVLLAFVALQAVLMAAPGRRRAVIGGALLAGAAALAVTLPLLIFFAHHPEWLFNRAGAITQGIDLPGNVLRVAASFTLSGDLNPRHNVPPLPLLDPLQALGFLVGLGWALWRSPRRADARTLLVWLALMALPSALTDSAPSFQRMVGVVPPAVTLTALGWGIVSDTARCFLRAGRWLWAVAGLLLMTSLVWNVYAVFGRWPRTAGLEEAFTTAPIELAQQAARRAGAGEWAFVERGPDTVHLLAFDYLLPGTQVIQADFRECLPLVDRSDQPATYLVLNTDPAALDRLLALYPQAAVPVRERALWVYLAATQVEVPAGAALPAPPRAALAHFAPGIALWGFEWSADEVAPGGALTGTLYWLVTAPVERDLTAFVHIGTALDEPLVAQHDAPPCGTWHPTSQWRPGEIVAAPFRADIPADAPPAEYPVAVGWYAYPSLERAPLVEAADPLPDNRAVIGTLRITAP